MTTPAAPGTVDTAPAAQATAGSAVDLLTAGVSPSAVAGPKSVAVHSLGEVLKHLIHNSGAYHDEGQVDTAVSTVDGFVKAYVPPQELPAIDRSGMRAAKEDVTQRIPPGGPMTNVVAGPVIDYNQLARAILNAQAEAQAQAAQGAVTPSLWDFQSRRC